MICGGYNPAAEPAEQLRPLAPRRSAGAGVANASDIPPDVAPKAGWERLLVATRGARGRRRRRRRAVYRAEARHGATARRVAVRAAAARDVRERRRARRRRRAPVVAARAGGGRPGRRTRHESASTPTRQARLAELQALRAAPRTRPRRRRREDGSPRSLCAAAHR